MNKLQTIQKGASIGGKELTEREVLSGVMRGAWALAKQGANKHGGKASDYIAESMKLMWDAMYKQSLGLIEKDEVEQARKAKESARRLARFEKDQIEYKEFLAKKAV